MFRFLIKFLKVLVIACIIGVSLRVVDVLFLNKKADNIITSNFTNEIKEDEKIELASDIINAEEQKSEEIPEEKIEIKQEEKVDTIQVKEEKKVNTKTEIKEEKKQEVQQKVNTDTITKTNNQEVVQKETQTQDNYTEIKVDIIEKKECVGNNHGISIGNSNKWFETKEDAIATYKAEIKKWGDKWSNNQISDDLEYYANCPIGYEIWDCPFCNKWTLNYHYDN